MFKKISPESAGISSDKVLNFIKTLDNYGFYTHSMIMARGNDIFLECYYKPFDKEFKHRMYSVSKSFVAVAIGLLIEDGLISLNDKFIDFFPESQNENLNELLKEATIEDMLKMESSMQEGINWFYTGADDRVKVYFDKKADKIPGTLFEYDSSGSFMLGVIVERLTGKPFLEYMKEKFLLKIGFSEDSYCLKAPGGYSWSDSGVMCSSMDLLRFARFVMNKGTWDGVRYVSKEFLDKATSRLVSNANNGHKHFNVYGYGYQIWKAPNDGFAFVGMGDQFAICDIEKDFIFVITSDNQGSSISRIIMYHELYKLINSLGEPMPENLKAQKELKAYTEGLELMHLCEDYDNPFISKIDGVKYKLEENPMNIEYIKFGFEGKKGTLFYKNAKGEKELVFGIGYNEFGYFPEEGYSDMVGTEKVPGHMYKCACSANWEEPEKLRIKVQVIDKYFGNACFVFGFKDNRVTVLMTKTAEAFLDEYNGFTSGKAE